MAAKINVRNEIVNQQCAVVQRKLSADGYECCILKGQGVAQLYTSTSSAQVQIDLRGFRQSGDIDVWVSGTTIPQLVEYVKGLGAEYEAMYAHMSFKPFDAKAGNGSETEVELHPTPSFLRGFGRNGKLQEWLRFKVHG